MVEGINTNTFNNFDVIGFAKNIINEIENIRSFDISTNSETSPNSSVPIESRINAFFRLIGLPMFVNVEDKNKKSKGKLSGKTYLSPGFFGATLDTYNIKNTDDGDNAFYLSVREGELNTIENSIGSELLNQNMANALRSSIPIQPNIPSDPNIIGGSVIGNGTIFERYVYKKLFPLITSYIDVMPKRNEIARPFTTNDSFKSIDNQTPLPRPFIETVVRIRLVSGGNAGNSNQLDKNEDIDNSLKSTIGNEEFDTLTAGNKDIFDSLRSIDTIESFIVIRLFQSIYQLANRWYRLHNMQQIFFKKIPYIVSVKTSSARKSVFGKRADVSADLVLDDKSEVSKKLKKLNDMIAKEEVLQTLLPSNDVIENTNNKSSAFATLVNPFSSLLNFGLEQLKKQAQDIENSVKKNIQEVDRLRVELEMMTGEFTGLSIVDVILIITALFIIDKEKLVALLDKYVIEDMKKDPSLESAINTMKNIGTVENAYSATIELEKIVTFLFSIFNAVNETIVNKKNRTNSVSKGNQRKIKDEKRYSMSDPVSEATTVQQANKG